MVQYTTLFLSIYSVVITAAAGIMLYLLLTLCGMETEIEGENNIVSNAQKIGIVSQNIAMNGDSSCKVWENYGFELFEYLILSFLAIALMYWGLRKIFRKKGLLDKMRKQKEEALAKQGIIVTEAIDMEEKIPEGVLKPLQG